MTTATETGLSVVPASSFLALGGGGAEMAEALASVSGESFGLGDLTRVKTPSGGATMWEVPDGLGGANAAKAITGVLCYVQKSGVLWPSFDPKPGGLPVLRTYDLMVAEQVGPIPDDMVDTLEKYRIDERHFKWAELPYNQFGSGKNGQGKRGREQRLLFILQPGDIYPTVVTCQPGSLKNIRKFLLNLPKAGVPYWGAIVELSLAKESRRGSGEPFSVIVPRLVGKLSAEDRALVKAKYTDKLSVIGKQMAVEEPPTDDDGDE